MSKDSNLKLISFDNEIKPLKVVVFERTYSASELANELLFIAQDRRRNITKHELLDLIYLCECHFNAIDLPLLDCDLRVQAVDGQASARPDNLEIDVNASNKNEFITRAFKEGRIKNNLISLGVQEVYEHYRCNGKGRCSLSNAVHNGSKTVGSPIFKGKKSVKDGEDISKGSMGFWGRNTDSPFSDSFIQSLNRYRKPNKKKKRKIAVPECRELKSKSYFELLKESFSSSAKETTLRKRRE